MSLMKLLGEEVGEWGVMKLGKSRGVVRLSRQGDTQIKYIQRVMKNENDMKKDDTKKVKQFTNVSLKYL